MQFQHKYLILAAAMLTFSLAANAQKDLEGDNVTVVKSFDAQLLEANKLSVPPTLPALDTTTKVQNYTVPPHPSNIKYDPPKLRPLGVKAAPKEADYDGFVKLGAGVPNTIWGEGGYYFKAKDKFDGKIWLRHHRLSADKAVENQMFQKTSGLLSGNIFLPNNLATQVDVGYTYDRVHFYGYNDDSLEFSPGRTRQDFKILDLGARLYNSARNDADLNFSVAPKFYLLTDFYSNKENHFELGLSATKWFNEKHALRVNIRPDLTSFEDTVSQKLNNIYLQPSFTLHFDMLQFKIGGNFVNNRDVFSIFPDAELTLRVWGDGIQAFVGANGDLRKNSYRSLSTYNPFIQIRGSELRNTRWDNYYGGLKGNFGWLEYNGQVGYSKASDLALHQTSFDQDGITRFRVLYDTVKMFNIQGTIKLNPIKNLSITGTYSQSIFDNETTGTSLDELAVWGLPEIEGNFGAVYTLAEGKANVKASLHMADRIAFLNEQNELVKSKTLVDLSFGGSYYFTKNIGVFLDINNLLNNRRERWYRYPTIGTNFLGGFVARF
ncbi:MAG TPA: hypothetical protein VK168_02370 [Saprospiraceae bacterium]|nr:hypothetical protein [Saprospiraceae bacterium]